MSQQATAQHHFDSIKHLHDNGGSASSPELIRHQSELSECYRKAATKGAAEAFSIQALVVHADKLIANMRQPKQSKSDAGESVKE